MKKLPLLLMIVFAVSVGEVCFAEIPHIITYQGRLTDSLGIALEGEYQMIFTIYDMPEDGSALWTSGPRAVYVEDGLFNCDLGTVTPVPDSVFHQHFERWLGITVGNGPEMMPRTIFNSVAFAYRSQLADVAGLSETAEHADHAGFAEETGEAGHAAFSDTALFAYDCEDAIYAGQAGHATDADNALYADTAAYAHAAPGGGFTLPYYGTATSANPAFAANNDGTGAGIRGQSSIEDGVVGNTTAADKSGVYGYSSAGIGVAGRAEGDNYGVFGKTTSSDTLYAGVYAEGPARGLIAKATDPGGVAGHFIGNKIGTQTVIMPGNGSFYCGNYTSIKANASSSDSASYIGDMLRIFAQGTDVCIGTDALADGGRVNYGINAKASNSNYVVSQATNYGVAARAEAGYINIGLTSTAHAGSWDSLTIGVEGLGINGDLNYGGLFYATGSDTNYGVYAEAIGGDMNYALYAKAPGGLNDWAGYFNGDVYISGTLYGVKSGIKIDHPLDPENKYLIHSGVESPEMLNVYNGNITTDDRGLAVVDLPEYFEACNTDFRYQLTVIGQFAQAIVAEEIENNRFSIRTDKPNVKVSWQVTGVRNDAAARYRPIETEMEKPGDKKGTYLNPQAFGLDEKLSEDYDMHYRRYSPGNSAAYRGRGSTLSEPPNSAQGAR